MFNRYKFSTLGAAALMTVSAFSQITATPGNRVIYGYSMGSAEFTETNQGYDCGFIAYPFNPNEDGGEIDGEMLNSYLDTPYIGVYAGTGVEGLLYVVEYEFSTSLTQPMATNLVCYNVFNGIKEIIGQWNPEQTDFKPQDMSYNEADGKIYAVGYEGSQSGLYVLDPSTAKFTKLYTLNKTAATLAIDSNGTFYSLTSDGALFTINPENGLTSTPIMYTDLGTMYSNQSMTFDKATGLLYWASVTFTYNPVTGENEGHDNCFLQEIDIQKKTIREVGQLGISNRMLALYLPSADNILSVAAPEVLVEPSADGAYKATLTFAAPSTTLNGTELDGSASFGTIYGYQIFRNYGDELNFKEPIYTNMSATIAPGQVITWEDTDFPEEGMYRYDVAFVNGVGLGAKGTYYQWIGPDAPTKVSNIKGDVINHMAGITLTWDAPTTGRHLGAFDPEKTTYTIVRLPDNATVAKDVKETTYTDNNIKRLLNYQYNIIATNEVGTAPDALSSSYILGPALEIPFDQSFEDAAQVQNYWTAIDSNNDGYTWLFNTTLGQTAFGDAEACAEYVVSPGLGNSEVGSADDWLISPPLKFEAGKEYEITLSTRSYTNDQVDIYMGDLNTGAAMTEKAGEIRIENDPTHPVINPVTGTQAFELHSVILPKVEEDAIRCVGIHLVTKHESHNFFQINNIHIGDPGSGVTDADAVGKNVKLSVNNKVVAIFGDFRQADVYDMSGRKVVSTSSAFIDMNNFAGGVYVIVVDGRSFKLAL
ncbi:MAG: choice-of-anchor J domain-containing protein [Muribaculaceae bacterium]|nr:choice-of-anchor J domain-containing protein [Muribaculaceae bacterium]